MFKTNETKYLYQGAKVTFKGTRGIIYKGIYKTETQERWFFFSNNCDLNGAVPNNWDEIKNGYHYSYAFALANGKEFPGSIEIHYPHNIPKSAFEEIKVGDIVKLINPLADDFFYGGIGLVKGRYAAKNMPPENWTAKVASISDDGCYNVQFEGIDSGQYKFKLHELKFYTRAIFVGGLDSLVDISASMSGTSNVIIGHTHVAPGAYTHSFIATPSGHVETLNDDMPLFKRVVVKPNKVPDLE